MVGARRPAIDQDDVEIATAPGENETGNAAAAAEVDDDTRDGVQGADECLAVGDDRVDRLGAEHADALRRRQGVGERLIGSCRGRGGGIRTAGPS